MISGLSCVILMKAHLRLSLHIKILITACSRPFLRNLVNRLMIILLGLSPLPVAYILVVLLHTLIMNVLSSCYMLLMIMYGA
jgi:hypothetical protein